MDCKSSNEKIRADLFGMRDEKYAEFHSRLMPGVDKNLVIGVRTPLLRKYAATLQGTEEASAFMAVLPHRYYEENNLHAFLVQNIKDIGDLLYELERFLPYIDNWATCDSLRPKAFAAHRDILAERVEVWLKSQHVYTVRYGIEMLMLHFLGEDFSEGYPLAVCNIKSDEYYINMMRAWYFAEALAGRYDDVIPYIEKKKLDPWTHGKTIGKAVESFKIPKEHKEYLRSLR